MLAKDAVLLHYIRNPKPWNFKRLIKDNLKGRGKFVIFEEWLRVYCEMLLNQNPLRICNLVKGLLLKVVLSWALSISTICVFAKHKAQPDKAVELLLSCWAFLTLGRKWSKCWQGGEVPLSCWAFRIKRNQSKYEQKLTIHIQTDL